MVNFGGKLRALDALTSRLEGRGEEAINCFTAEGCTEGGEYACTGSCYGKATRLANS